MHDGFQMVARRIPYPATTPKYFAAASEVTVLAFLHSIGGLPTSEVYPYSPTPDKAAGTEHIFMQFIEGTNLTDIWSDLREEDIISILRQLESKVTLITFPAGRSPYLTEDLANATWSVSVPTSPSISLKDKRFCVGPQTSVPLWYGRGSQLDVDRRPSRDRFCVHRPDFQPSNIIVPLSSVSSSYVVVGLIDWQHPSDLPLSLQAGIPQWLQNYDDAGWEPTTPTSLPENLNDLGETRSLPPPLLLR
ncbi:hypothetical protein EV401DRAFT_2077431 [Pisolithus croceorrhizus]|nr:hypothetical protein EV401DRAFT_2077431 [Pisolithus croceorrhizus]